jgi:hypothetical protein
MHDHGINYRTTFYQMGQSHCSYQPLHYDSQNFDRIFSGGRSKRPNASLSIKSAMWHAFWSLNKHHWIFLVCVGGWTTCICCVTSCTSEKF